MSQSHTLYNLDKRECVRSRNAQLMSQCGTLFCTATALWLLLANSNGRGGGDAKDHPMIGRWAGDRIVVQGDYARFGDPGFITHEEERAFTDISVAAQDMVTYTT